MCLLPCLQGGDGGLLPLPAAAAAAASRGGPLHDAEPLGGPRQEAGDAALPQYAQLPKRHLPVHAALQALVQRKETRLNPPPLQWGWSYSIQVVQLLITLNI